MIWNERERQRWRKAGEREGEIDIEQKTGGKGVNGREIERKKEGKQIWRERERERERERDDGGGRRTESNSLSGRIALSLMCANARPMLRHTHTHTHSQAGSAPQGTVHIGTGVSLGEVWR